MYLFGSFLSQLGDVISVYIITNNDKTNSIEIGSNDAGVFFSDNPVTIDCKVNDTFDHLLKYQATINLQTKLFLKELFCPSCRDAVVNIYKGDTCLFAGFIEPMTYSQAYNDVYDELSINCIDTLSALQYSKYKNIGAGGTIYDFVKSASQNRTFYDIIKELLGSITSGIDIFGGHHIRYLYDGSKAIDDQQNNHYIIFKQLSIHELLFLGDSEDDVWEQDTVLEEILRFLNLHIVQYGFDFYIFDWRTIKDSSDIIWYNLVDDSVISTIRQSELTIALNNVVGTNTKISIGEVYNQLRLTCDIKSIENVIESPLDENLLKSPYSNKQKYMTEYVNDFRDAKDFSSFYNMIHGLPSDNPNGHITTWFVQVMANKRWAFGAKGTNFIDQFCKNNVSQQNLPNALRDNPGCAILALGKVTKNIKTDDNSPVSKVDMTNYLCIGVNGNEIDNDEVKTYPGPDILKNNIPYATYNGAIGGGSLSPSDDTTTNYIVFSGSIILNPIMHETGAFNTINKMSESDLFAKYYRSMVPSRNSDHGRYYTQQFWESTAPSSKAISSSRDTGFVPFTNEGPQLYEFKYSAVGDNADHISKIAVLACMLIIGDKCVVETGTAGQISDFTWKTYKSLDQCSSEDEYYQQSFTLGFDPKIGDKLIGTEFSMQNNIDYTMNIDAEGIAIPIHKSDHVSGDIKFIILGPVNTVWDEVSRRHPTFFRHTKWSSTSVPLLAHVSDILFSKFEAKIYSDNGLINNSGNNDLVYLSDTSEKFINKKDDIKFKINSALTLQDCQQLGVTNSVKLSNPTDISGIGITDIYDYNFKSKAKPERLYINDYYNEYHQPRILLSQEVVDNNTNIDPFRHYIHPALSDKKFFVQGINRNLIEGSAELSLKEIDND
nr:hypothetical protein [uncultured Prevotella sp.]